MTTYEMVGYVDREHKEKSTFVVTKTKKLHGNKRMVQVRIGKEPPIWCFGFMSWDALGIVYQHPHRPKTWCFFRTIEEYPVYQRPLTKYYSDGTPRQMSIGEKVMIGIMNEQECVRVLRPLLKPLHVYSMPGSGYGCGGTDIIITEHEELELMPECVDRARWAVSVVNYCVRRSLILINTKPADWYARVGDRGVYSWVENRYTDHEIYKFYFVHKDAEVLTKKQAISTKKLSPVYGLDDFTNIVSGKSSVSY